MFRVKLWKATLAAGSALLLTAAMAAAPAGARARNEENAAARSARMLRGIRVDANHVHAASIQLDRLATRARPAWSAADRRWNEIKPAVEDMQLKLDRLEAMKTTSPDPDQAAIQATTPLVQEIGKTTADFHAMLEKGSPVNASQLKGYAQALMHASDRLASAAQPAS